MFSTLRNASRTTTAVIAIGLLGTIGADIATAAQSGSGAAVAAGHHGATTTSDQAAQHTYLQALRPVALAVIHAVGPAENVMEAIALPHAGDAFAARDALVRGDALPRLRAARHDLQRLHPPASLAAKHRGMLTATQQMIDALVRLHALRSFVNGARIIAKIDAWSGNKLGTAEGTWDRALEAVYHPLSLPAPADFTNLRHTPVSSTKWIFGADRACSAATYKLGDLAKIANVQTISAAEQWDRRWAKALSFVGKRLTGLKQPSGSFALPRLLRSRLRVLKFNARLFGHELAGLQHESFSAVQKADNQIKEVMPSLRALSAEMNLYGARSCGLIIGEWSGKHPPAAPSQHHRGTVST